MKEWSIIIPALNEEAHIGSCLESLQNLAYPKGSFEVIVVDNGSMDRTVSIANSYARTLNLNVLSIPNGTVAALRNAGAAIAVGRRLAFLDADCVVVGSWLSRASQILQTSPGSVIGSFYNVAENAAWPARIWHRHISRQRKGRVSYIPASNVLLEKALFLEIGGFDANLDSNEDSELCAKANAHGADVVAFPELAITHLGAEKNLSAFIRRQFWHGSSVLNRAAFGNNVRAIGIATYTFVCLIWLVLAIALGKVWLMPLGAIVFPPIALAARSTLWRSCFQDIPALTILVLAYSLARAVALPVALFNCARLDLIRNIERESS